MRWIMFSACLGLGLNSGAAVAKKAPPAPPQPSAALIRYELPSTVLKVSVGFTLTSCVGKLFVKPEVTFTPSVTSTEHPEWRFELDGRRLESFWKSKKLTLETYPDGSIKSLNGGLTDQTGSIITSVVKIAATALALDASANQPASLANKCSSDIANALVRVASMTARIKELRIQLATAAPTSVDGITKTIDALAAEVARLQTNELRVDLSHDFVIERGLRAATLSWNSLAFKKWLPPGVLDFPITDFAIGLCFKPAPVNADEDKLACSSNLQTGMSRVPDKVTAVVCAYDEDCSTTIVLREPMKAVVQAFAIGTGFDGVTDDKPLKKGNFMAAQWGELSFLPLTVGFGKSVNFAMGFDEYGHKLSQTWDSASRGASILGTASSVSDSLAGIYKTEAGAKLAADKAEIDQINTAKALNQARFCRAVYDAGGVTCP